MPLVPVSWLMSTGASVDALLGAARITAAWVGVGFCAAAAAAFLASDDARRAFRTMRTLAARPKEAPSFLTNQLQPLINLNEASPERLQADRALEALELTGGEEGRRALVQLAAKAKNSWVKEVSAESLQRMNR